MTKYRTIVADPPWPISDMPTWFKEERQSRRERVLGTNPRPYDVMTIGEITELPVAGLAAGQAHLYLWTITEHLEAAFGVARSWRFAPSAALVWCKPERPGGLGGTFAANVEFILFATRDIGDPDSVALGTWLRAQREAAGLSAKAVCAAIGAHGSVNHGGAVANWESGLNAPNRDQWTALKRAVGFGDDMDEAVERVNAAKGARSAIGSSPTRWFQWPRAEHSRKPEAFLDLVEQVSPGPYLELFARRQRLGWDTWGDEALNHVGRFQDTA